MIDKDHYNEYIPSNAKLISQSVHLETIIDTTKLELYKKFQLQEEVYNYVETLESPYKFMATQKNFNFEWLRDSIANFIKLTIVHVLIFSSIFGRLLLTPTYIPLYLIIISGVAFCIVSPLIFSLLLSGFELSDLKRKEELTRDIVTFKEIINKLEKHISKNKEKYNFKEENIIFYRFIKIDYCIYNLFYRTKTFALESFLEADRIQDYDTQFSIIKPMIEDISGEILAVYKKHIQIEKEAAELQRQKLKEQVEFDLHAYENRVLKEKRE